MASDFYGIRAEWNSRDIKAILSALEPRQWTYAIATALNEVAKRVKAREVEAMAETFDRPTPFTLNSLRINYARKDKLEAGVRFKDPTKLTEREHYLLPEVYGGDRQQKRFEGLLWSRGLLPFGKMLVPASGARKDAYGNVVRGVYSQILSQLYAQHDPIQNTTRRSRARRRGRATFFMGRPGGGRLGIYERVTGGLAGGWPGSRLSNRVVPVFLVTDPPKYRPVFPFFNIAEQTTTLTIATEFDRAVRRALETTRK